MASLQAHVTTWILKRRLKPKLALLTHLSHDYDYEVTNRELPPNVRLAYDNMVFEVSD